MANARLGSRYSRCCEPPIKPGRGGNGGQGGAAGKASPGSNGGDVYFVGSPEFLAATRDFTVDNYGGLHGIPGQIGLGGSGAIGAPTLNAAPGCGGAMPAGANGTKGNDGKEAPEITAETLAGKVTEIEYKFL